MVLSAGKSRRESANRNPSACVEGLSLVIVVGGALLRAVVLLLALVRVESHGLAQEFDFFARFLSLPGAFLSMLLVFIGCQWHHRRVLNWIAAGGAGLLLGGASMPVVQCNDLDETAFHLACDLSLTWLPLGMSLLGAGLLCLAHSRNQSLLTRRRRSWRAA